VTPWATLAADLITEWQVGDSKITLPGSIEYVTPFHRTYPATSIPTKRQDVVNASFGAKFTVRGGMVIVVNGIVPIKHAGLQPNFAMDDRVGVHLLAITRSRTITQVPERFSKR
jgi:hypothetical protein